MPNIEVHHPNGDTYRGEWSTNGKHPDGFGTMLYKNSGDVYSGQWIDGKRHGFGAYFYHNDGYYVGEWKDGQRDGDGARSWKDGSSYNGQWAHDKRQGHAVFKNHSGTFIGVFNNNAVGKGVWTKN